MGLQLITPPDESPITLSDVKTYLRIPSDDVSEDDNLQELIGYAVEWFEAETGQALGEGIYRLTLDRFPCDGRREILLPMPPLVSVETVQYLSSGSLATFAGSNYTVDATGKPGRIALKSTAGWPTADAEPNAVRIDFTAGYGGPADVPLRARQAIRWIVGHAYENREPVNVGNIVNELPLGIRSIVEAMTVREYVA